MTVGTLIPGGKHERVLEKLPGGGLSLKASAREREKALAEGGKKGTHRPREKKTKSN